LKLTGFHTVSVGLAASIICTQERLSTSGMIEWIRRKGVKGQESWQYSFDPRGPFSQTQTAKEDFISQRLDKAA
jgi:hypothetical protein